MELIGEKASIQITIDAGSSSNLFSIAYCQILQKKEVPVSPNRGQPQRANFLSSAEKFLGIRYLGGASIGQLASQIPVTLRPTDAEGATVRASTTV